MMWPYVALVSIGIFWVGLAILLTRWPLASHKSISQHSAASRESFKFFTLIQSSVGVMTYLFMILWFIPTFNLPSAFVVVYTIVAWLQIISAFIPDTGSGRKSTMHSKMAYSFALGLVLCSLFLFLASSIPALARIFFAFTLFFMLYAVFKYLHAKRKSERMHNYLFLQVTFIVSFQLSVLVTAFLS